MNNTTQQGKFGEQIALKYFLERGYCLLYQNYFIQAGELDLILQKNGIIIFVEVKMRTGKNFGTAAEALTINKKRKLLRTIFIFLERLGRHRLWQLDLLAIHYEQSIRTAQVRHFPNILES